MTPEAADTERFRNFIAEKKMMRQLDRIVIDECHVVLEASQTWRPEMWKMIKEYRCEVL